jgi:hypothetical protein
MENKDFLMRQVESIEIILKKIFSRIVISNDSAISEAGIAEIGDLLKGLTGLNLKEIANCTDEEFLTALVEKKLGPADMSDLIDVLVDLAREATAEILDFDAINLAKKALYIHAYITKSQKTVYYNNVNSIARAKNLINKIS